MQNPLLKRKEHTLEEQIILDYVINNGDIFESL